AAHRLSLLLLLAFLAADRFVTVFDALALIGLGTAERANHGRDLADALLIGAAHRDRGRLLASNLDVRRDRGLDVVAVAELQHEIFALHRGAIADAVDLQIDGVSGVDAADHVVDERARRAPGHAGALGLVLWRDDDLAVLHDRIDLAVEGELQ